ncbi:MAG: imidazoleglycerol-phosphate dehydratase HisB [Spirochaetes bacterium]|nr:imidazoleglycerol-phosphate dehydratase HisB [Spirochaetota bacterium]
MERKAIITRRTSETDIKLSFAIDTSQPSRIFTGIPFFDHMLSSMARHGHFALDLQCTGDTEVDDHHTVEDVGICLGKAIHKALGEKVGILRFGDALIPMDDALAHSAVDLSGRAYFCYRGPELTGRIGNYSEELTLEFLRALSTNAEFNLHIIVHHGQNRHHIHESIFKSVAIALRKAWAFDESREGEIPSTKGTIS